MSISEEDLEKLLGNVKKGKKDPQEYKDIQKDLFNKPVSVEILKIYENLFKLMTESKEYLYVSTEVVGKKNNYKAYFRYTGKSNCCSAPYDKKTKICTACGRTTKPESRSDKVGLNKRALAYQNDTHKYYAKLQSKFNSKRISEDFVLVGLMFIRGSKRRFDFDNLQTMVADQLTKSGMIPDDSGDKLIIIPMGYVVRPKHPGVIIKVINHLDYFRFLTNACSND